MNKISVPTYSVVVAIGGKRAPFAEVLDLVPFHASPWNIQKPDQSEEALRATLKEHGSARVAIKHAHPKAIRDVVAIARKHGANAIILRLPGAPNIEDGASKAHAVYDVMSEDAVSFEIVPMPSDMRHLTGPFDMIGDIHGAVDELEELMTMLGHMVDGKPVRHPRGRIPVFLGDYTDRGPRNVDALNLVRAYTQLGGIAVAGNHDVKASKALRGRDVRIAAGLEMTLAEAARQSEEWRLGMADWIDSLQTHLLLDGGKLVVAHAGLDEEHHGRHTSGATAFALYGKSLDGGKTLDDDGFPAALDWALEYKGTATVVHGHVVHPKPRVVANENGGAVVSVDTGVVFGGSLSAYRWPERDFVEVKAHQTWFSPKGRQVMA